MRVVAAVAAILGLVATDVMAGAFDCIMDPSRSIDLANAAGGIIEEVTVSRGARVNSGDIVARLASSVERATVRALEIRAFDSSPIDAELSRLDFLQRRLERNEQRRDRGVATLAAIEEILSEVETTRARLERARMERATAEQELERARAALERTEIRSPIDGLVADRALDEGEYLHPESHVATIVRLDPLQIDTFVPVELYGQIGVGDVATVSPSAPIGGAYPATVTVIDQVFDAASGTFLVRLQLPNPGATLPAGHRCTVAFDLLTR
jgi:RND family efflux transporter MFP subunit